MSATSDYTSVEPFQGEHFNYHELGILAANEMAINHNTLMQAIGLQELAAFEQTGSTDVFYEAVNVSGVIEKIKAFFKKIIEKIHKLFHTFIAKMGSWFSGNANFVKKYEKEVVKGWANVKNDLGFKGYKYNLPYTDSNGADGKLLTASDADSFKLKIEGIATDIKNAIENVELKEFVATTKGQGITEADIKATRDKMDDIKDGIRKSVATNGISDAVTVSASNGGYDQSEFTEELFKKWRSGEDSKEELSKSDITTMYGGSLTSMMIFVKEFDKIKTKLETAEKKITKGIDKQISNIDKAQSELVKANRDSSKTDAQKTENEHVVQGASLIQTLYGCLGECTTQYFGSLLQATKDACAQAKEIMVKVVGQSKKVTEESADVTSEYGDFLASVELV